MNHSSETSLTQKKIFKFWLPLAATWLMMAAEGPFLAAIIARLVDPKYNLAAYGVAFSFALIIESPVIMVMSASTRLVKDNQSFYKLRNFVYGLNILTTFVMLIFLIPPVFNSITLDLINLDSKVASLTYIATFVLLPWPAAIGYRRFAQGLMIANNATRRVAYGTVVRLFSMGSTALLLYSFTNLNGAVIGASALSAGVVLEAFASRFMASKLIKLIKDRKTKNSENILSYKGIFHFYLPLALTSFITLAIHPMVTFFIGQSRMSLESLAVLPVLNSLVFIFRSLGLSFQEVAIALLGSRENYIELRRFAFRLAAFVVGVLGILAFTPLAEIWLMGVSGLSIELTTFARLPLMIYFVFPALTVFISFQRAIMVYHKNTKPVTYATTMEFLGVFIMLFVLIKFFSVIGVIAAIIAYTSGRTLANLYLLRPVLNVLKNNEN